MIEYWDFITRVMVQKERDKLFVFGDNFLRQGFGGQAKEIRGEPNSVGIITKRRPYNNSSAFLVDDDLDEWILKSKGDIQRLMNFKGVIVWPYDGIGTGLSKLESSSPKIWDKIQELEQELFET